MTKKTGTILDKIINDVRTNLYEKKKIFSDQDIVNLANEKSRKIISLTNRIRQKSPLFPKNAKLGLIAEIKRASPSKGVFDINFDVNEVAEIYASNGVSGISILTEPNYFLGDINDLQKCYANLSEKYTDSRPAILRKDFIVDPFQVYESYVNGADSFLLIVKILENDQLFDLINLGKDLGLEALVEVHNIDELDNALSVGAKLIGINNRNLEDFSEDLNTTIKLADKIPNDVIIISESGIRSVKDIRKLLEHKVDAVLIGEAFMSGGFNKDRVSKKIRSLMLVE